MAYWVLVDFFLLSAKTFLVVFFLIVQLSRTEDLHLLQFLTNPALTIHNFVYLLTRFEKSQLFGH